MKTLLNIIWLVLSGIWMAIGYVIAGTLMFLTIIGIPFGLQSFKLAGYALWPFGRSLVKRPGRHVTVSVIGNVLWFFLGGWYLALGHLISGVLLCLTIIGIPLGIGSFKMAGAALHPFGREVVKLGLVPESSAITIL
jgi:uncharacterized membrane protein YccF (DUF307 family)